MIRIIILVFVLALWPAPGFSGGRPPAVIRKKVGVLNRAVAKNQRRSYLAANPNLDPNIAACIERGGTMLGMTKEQVCASIGNPLSRKELSGSRSKWYYPDDAVLFFRGNKLVGRKNA